MQPKYQLGFQLDFLQKEKKMKNENDRNKFYVLQ